METVNQEVKAPETNQNEQGAERTFSQVDVDRIVADRLLRERQKYVDYDALKDKASKYEQMEEASKTELQKANERAAKLQKELDDLKQAETVRQVRAKVSKETGVPETLLTAGTEEECKAQAEAIKAFADPGYPKVKDGGENRPMSTKQTTSEQFADWFNSSFGQKGI